jgi:hypothetical protein
MLKELRVPERRNSDNVNISGRRLLRIALKRKKSSASTDGWKYAQLAMLPEVFFELLARLCNEMCNTGGHLPEAWQNVRVCLIPKPGNGTRPISIAAAAWRLCATAILDDWKTWILSWATDALSGGVPGRGVDDALAAFEAALDDLENGSCEIV